jgi:hypothetical protein
MKINAINLLGQAAGSLKRDDPMRAFSLYELANNLAGLMRGDHTLEEFKAVYVGQDREPFDIDKLMPVQAES